MNLKPMELRGNCMNCQMKYVGEDKKNHCVIFREDTPPRQGRLKKCEIKFIRFYDNSMDFERKGVVHYILDREEIAEWLNDNDDPRFLYNSKFAIEIIPL